MAVYINASAMVSAQKTLGDSKWTENVVLPENSCLSIQEPVYKEYIPAAKLRRMSRLVKFSLVSAFDCINQLEGDQLDAIVTTTGLGCIDDTGVFLKQMHENGESLMNPTAFIRSTHNAVGGQIALLKGLRIPNFTYTQKENTFETGLIDTMMMLEEGDANNVLLGGFDELTSLSSDLWKQMGCLSESGIDKVKLEEGSNSGVVLGEAAGFFTLSSNRKNTNSTELVDVEICRNANGSVKELAVSFLKKNNLNIADIDLLILGLDGTARTKYLKALLDEDFQSSNIAGFKHLSGSFDTDTCFALWMAHKTILDGNISEEVLLKSNKEKEINTILIINSSRANTYLFTLVRK